MSCLKWLQRLLPFRSEYVARYVTCVSSSGLHRMAYTEWGTPDNPDVVICVHGLTRNGRDFDKLARVLAKDYRVICPDVVGRGQSDWLKDPAGYGFPQYVADMFTLIARLNVNSVRWVGTSMGGLIGMFIASLSQSPISHLVLNDVGPEITADALRRIAAYVGKSPRFSSQEEAVAYLRQINAPFGELSAQDWLDLTKFSVQQADDGLWLMRYDPAIGDPFRKAMVYGDINLWPIYEQVHCPVLLTRGMESDLLSVATAKQMCERGPKATLLEFPKVGHAPMFLDVTQIEPVRQFLSIKSSSLATVHSRDGVVP